VKQSFLHSDDWGDRCSSYNGRSFVRPETREHCCRRWCCCEQYQEQRKPNTGIISFFDVSCVVSQMIEIF